MKKLFTLLYILIAFYAKGDYWTQKADFGGVPRWGATGCSMGNKGYIGTGQQTGLYSDFWEYNSSTNVWIQKANFGGVARVYASSFSLNNKIYIGCGIIGPSTYCHDFWEYDPITNSWTQKANVGILGRGVCVSFSINTKGYIGTGQGPGYMKDFWEYDAATNTWAQKADFGGAARSAAAGFSNGIKGYIGTGVNGSTWPLGTSDFWEYDPTNNFWTQKASFGGTASSEGCAFWLCPYGYLGLGTTHIGSGTISNFWKYNILTNAWTQVANYGPGLREMAVALSIGNKAYVGTGFINDNAPKKDFWEYTPDTVCATGIEEFQISNFEFQISPNPAKDYIIIKYSFKEKEKINLTITDVDGKIVHQSPLAPKGEPQMKISVEDLSAGIYFVELTNGKQKAVKKFVKE